MPLHGGVAPCHPRLWSPVVLPTRWSAVGPTRWPAACHGHRTGRAPAALFRPAQPRLAITCKSLLWNRRQQGKSIYFESVPPRVRRRRKAMPWQTTPAQAATIVRHDTTCPASALNDERTQIRRTICTMMKRHAPHLILCIKTNSLLDFPVQLGTYKIMPQASNAIQQIATVEIDSKTISTPSRLTTVGTRLSTE